MASNSTSKIHRQSRFRRVSALASIAVLCAGPFAFASSVAAHDVVVGSNPENGSVVQEFPETIELEFSGVPQDLFTTVAVSDSNSGEVLFTGEPQLEEQHISLDVPDDVETGPGSYLVGFQITSSDGHATKGSISFDVEGEVTAVESEPSESVTETSETNQVSESAEETAADNAGLSAPWNWLLSGVAVLAIAAAIVMAIFKYRNNK